MGKARVTLHLHTLSNAKTDIIPGKVSYSDFHMSKDFCHRQHRSLTRLNLIFSENSVAHYLNENCCKERKLYGMPIRNKFVV